MKKADASKTTLIPLKRPDYSGLIALAGSGVIDPNYDPKALFLDQPKPLTQRQQRYAKAADKR